MPVRSDDPLRRVTLNLYEADCLWLEKAYGRGWTERVRQHIHSEVVKRNEPKRKDPGSIFTLGDFLDD
jgi:hypothetical protein